MQQGRLEELLADPSGHLQTLFHAQDPFPLETVSDELGFIGQSRRSPSVRALLKNFQTGKQATLGKLVSMAAGGDWIGGGDCAPSWMAFCSVLTTPVRW